MRKQINLKRTVFVLFAAMFILMTSAIVATAQNTQKFKIGDRVECDYIGTHEYWNKGTVVEFPANDMFNGYKPDSGYYYRVKFDGQDSVIYCKAVDVRPLTVAKPTANQNTDNNQSVSKNDAQNNDNQNQPTKNGEYKVGDRVEVLIGGKWFPATVVRGLEQNAYGVQQDRFAGKGVYEETIKPYDLLTPSEVRALNDGSKSPVAPQMPAMREPVKCPEQSNAKGGAIPLPLAKQLIKCLWEEMSTERSVINVDLHTAQVGSPRPWKLTDIGTGVPGRTMIYPVKTTWTWKNFAPDGSSVSISEVEGVHNCYINAFNKWQCGLAESKNLKPLQIISKQ